VLRHRKIRAKSMVEPAQTRGAQSQRPSFAHRPTKPTSCLVCKPRLLTSEEMNVYVSMTLFSSDGAPCVTAETQIDYREINAPRLRFMLAPETRQSCRSSHKRGRKS